MIESSNGPVLRVSLAALSYNLRQAGARLPEGAEICAVVKANSYGLGAVPIAQYFQSQGISIFGVARLEEAIELREAGITGRLIMLSPPVFSDLPLLRKNDILFSPPSVEFVQRACCTECDKPMLFFLNMETGMGRGGLLLDEIRQISASAAASPEKARLEGVFTHFATSEQTKKRFRKNHARQKACFSQGIEELRVALGSSFPSSLSNTGDLAFHSTPSQQALPQDFCRIGAYLYGFSQRPIEGAQLAGRLEAPLVCIKKVDKGTPISYGALWKAPTERYIGVVAIGYGDGYIRAYSKKGWVMAGGKRYKIVGAISMDQTMIDLGPSKPSLKEGDPVVLIGSQPGEPTAYDLARWGNSIPTEVYTLLAGRIRRVYE